MFGSLHDELRSVETDGLSRAGLCELLGELGRLRSRLDSVEATALQALDALGDRGADPATTIRGAQRLTSRDAKRRARRADTLATMPVTAAALADGTLSAPAVDALIDAAARTSPALVDSSELIDLLRQRPLDLARREINTWITRHETPDDTRDRHHRQRDARTATCARGPDGMYRLRALLDPVTGAHVASALDAAVDVLWRADGGRDGTPDEVRTNDQRRADALAELICGERSATTTPTPLRHQMLIVATLNGDGHLNGDIAGVGPIPTTELERLHCDADLHGLLFSRNGLPLWHGRRIRTVSPQQWRALVARDRGCVHCGAQPSRCQAHHLIPWQARGPTDIDNLALVCGNYHHHLHDHGLLLQRQPNGTWTETPDPRLASQPPDTTTTHRPTRAAA